MLWLQYGRQNIESVKKRNGNRDEDDNTEEECESPTITDKNSTVTSTKTENGCVGNTVIARSKDLILVPEPEMHNNKNPINENIKTDHETATIDDKEVDLGGEKYQLDIFFVNCLIMICVLILFFNY